MAALRFVSPERGWRAGLLLIPGVWSGWALYRSFGIAAGCAAGVLALGLALLTMRTSLTVTGDELIDHRALRVVGVPWAQIAGFRVGRPGGLWDGYCIVAARHDGTEADLLSTRVYSRAPSAQHLEELEQTCQALRGLLAAYGEILAAGP